MYSDATNQNPLNNAVLRRATKYRDVSISPAGYFVFQRITTLQHTADVNVGRTVAQLTVDAVYRPTYTYVSVCKKPSFYFRILGHTGHCHAKLATSSRAAAVYRNSTESGKISDAARSGTVGVVRFAVD